MKFLRCTVFLATPRQYFYCQLNIILVVLVSEWLGIPSSPLHWSDMPIRGCEWQLEMGLATTFNKPGYRRNDTSSDEEVCQHIGTTKLWNSSYKSMTVHKVVRHFIIRFREIWKPRTMGLKFRRGSKTPKPWRILLWYTVNRQQQNPTKHELSVKFVDIHCDPVCPVHYPMPYWLYM